VAQRPDPAEGSTKAAQFIQLCDRPARPGLPAEPTGYMSARRPSRAGAIKHGSKDIQAVAKHGAKFTVGLGGS